MKVYLTRKQLELLRKILRDLPQEALFHHEQQALLRILEEVEGAMTAPQGRGSRGVRG